MSDHDTLPQTEKPCDCEQDPAARFAELVGNMLAPIRDSIERLRADLGLANGQTRSVLHRVTDLEDRVAALEDEQ